MDEATDYLDPGLSDTAEGWGVMWNVYLPLLGYRHVNGEAGAKLVPYLATALPRISKDGRTYTLTLRKGLKYSDGSNVKASDFKATIERDFLLDSAGAALFKNIEGAKQFAKSPQKLGGIRGIIVHDPTRDRDPPRASAGRLRERARVGVRGAGARGLAADGHVPQSAPIDRPVRDHELPADVADRRAAQSAFQGLALRRQRAGRQPRSCDVGHRPERVGRAPPRPDGQGRLDELLPGSRQTAARDREEAQDPPAHVYPAEPHVLLHEHAGAAVHEPQGSASRELRDLAPLAQASGRRPRPHDGEHPAAGLPVIPGPHPLPARSAEGETPRARVGLSRESTSSSGTTTFPAIGPSRITSSRCWIRSASTPRRRS